MRQALLGLVVVVASACAATTRPPTPRRTTSLALRMVPATLPNGLRVVFVADPNASEVQVTTRYRVGANDDPPGQEGIAHLVEHLMFQPVLGAQSLFAKLEETTSSFGGVTRYDSTTYTARANPARLVELLSIEATRLGFQCAMISESVFEREREVVLNELRLREATWDLWAALHRALYPEGHPYRRLGTVETVAAITREQACEFAQAHYAPSNAVLVVSGPLSGPELDHALGRFIARIPRRDAPAPAVVPEVPATFRRIDGSAPIDGTAILVAWPLPRDPAARVTVATVAQLVKSAISARGLAAEHVTFGDSAASMIGLFVLLDEDDDRPTGNVVSEIEAAVGAVPTMLQFQRPAWLAQVLRDRLKQGAIYDAFSKLEEGSERDEMIAANVLAGRDPNKTFFEQSAALDRLSAEEMVRIARTYLRYEQATVAVLTGSEAAKRGPTVKLAAPVHDIGLRRDLPDPEEARRPANAIPTTQRALAGMKKRTLANGLDVVLLPVTSVPTVELRLVFGSGTADDPVTERGAALAAGRMLDWNPSHVEDLLGFAAGGATPTFDVDADHTAFGARGVDMHLDLLLTGLRRWVRDGIYDKDDLAAIRKAGRAGTAERALDEAWRTALFGASHPYAHVNTVSPTLDLAAVEAYRKTHYTPDNATLVIAGRFDAALADRWIDYLFADWKGGEPRTADAHAATSPVSIASDDDATQVGVRIAIPTARGGRAEQLVAAAMLNVIVQDIRHQLGASYAFEASLDEARLASTYVIGGWIDAPRARDAFELVRLRLAALQRDPEAAARTFVTARRRVIVRLLRSTSSAQELADRVQHDVGLDRAPLSDAQTAATVDKLTIDAMTEVLADLDLARAVVVLRGPRETIDDAFAALGRTPKRIAVRDDEDPQETSQPDEVSESMDPSDPQTSRSPWTFGAFLGYTYAYASDRGVDGVSVSADLGYRFKRRLASGLHLSIASLDGTYEAPLVTDERPRVSGSVVRIAGFLQFAGADARQWGSVYAGASMVGIDDDGASLSETAIGIGAHGGYDVANFSGHHITVYGRLDVDLASRASFAAFTFGLGYRRR